MRSTRMALLVFVACMLAPLWTGAQYITATYSAGRCDGSVQLGSGDQLHLTPVDPPGPQAFLLWMLVQGGEGNVIVTDGQASGSEGLYFHGGDLLFFATPPPFDLYFQGGTMRLAYGGAVLGAPAAPVCGTGSKGPVILRVDQRLDGLMESSTAGASVHVASYASVATKYSGTLSYGLATGYTLQGTFSLPTCTGSGCCDPQQVVAPMDKAASVPYTVFSLTTSPAVDLDYRLAPPGPLAATASATPISGTAPLAVAFTGSASGGTPPYTWDWDFGDGTAHKTTQNASHTYQAGTFHPILKVKDKVGASAQDTHLSIASGSSFSVAGNADPTQGSAPLSVAFSSTVTGGVAPYTFEWDFGDGSPKSTDQNPSHSYASVGVYHVLLTAGEAGGATATDSHLTIKALGPGILAASAQADKSFGLLPLSVNFTGSASGGTPPYSYSWVFGDGSAPSTDKDPAHTYGSQGTFYVSFTVRDSGDQTAIDDHVRIFVTSSFLVVASASPISGPVPLAVQFTSALTGGTGPFEYAWDFGDGGASTLPNPAHTYVAGGLYPVTVTVKDSASLVSVDDRLLISAGGGGDGPVVTSVSKLTDPFRLKVTGTRFQAGCLVLISDFPAPVVSYKSPTQVVAKGGTTLKGLVPKGVPVCVQVRNPDGQTSPCYPYIR